MTTLPARERPWPDTSATLPDSVLGFFQFIHTTAVNKVAGLDEEQARATPLTTSPAMSVLGLVKHLTAVQRQHIQVHIGRQDLPLLWRHDDTTFDFRIGADETIDVLQESARHLGHLDIIRELIDGVTGE